MRAWGEISDKHEKQMKKTPSKKNDTGIKQSSNSILHGLVVKSHKVKTTELS